jgi:hypothetical protein
MIAEQSRGIVLQFRSGERRPALCSPRPVTRKNLPTPPPHPPTGGDGDEGLNGEWDLLIRLASHAWSWRDPESLDTLETTVARLRTWVARDWSA